MQEADGGYWSNPGILDPAPCAFFKKKATSPSLLNKMDQTVYSASFDVPHITFRGIYYAYCIDIIKKKALRSRVSKV